MSSYGPPGGPYGGAYPGQPGGGGGPGDPRDPRDPYEPPSDPWLQGDDPWRDDELTAPQPPGLIGGGYGPSPAAAAPPASGREPAGGERPPPGMAGGGGPGPHLPPGAGPGLGPGADPQRSGNKLLVVTMSLLVLVVAAGVGYALYLLSGEEGAPAAAPTASPGAAPTGAAATPTVSPGAPRNNIGLNAAMAGEGDCLVNHASDADPELQIVPCDSDESGPVYEVLARTDTEVAGDDATAQDASAQETCQGTQGYTHHYFEIGESLSFVLCLAEVDEPDDPEDDPDGSEDDE